MKLADSDKKWLTPRSVTFGAVGANTALAVGKIAVGIACSSQAILADGFHSASDLVTDAAVLAGLKVARKPADREHPYGHRRVTTLVAMFVGAMLLAAGGWIAYSAILSIHEPRGPVRATLPFWIAVAAVPIKELLFRVTRYIGRKEADMSLLANAWHHRTDAFSSIAAAAGLAGVLLGGPSWAVLDAITALLLAAFLVVVAGRIIITCASELADSAPKPETLNAIELAVADTPGVVSFHAFRARSVGGKVEMDIHVQVDPGLTVRQGHSIASAVKAAAMRANSNVVSVIVHVEPAIEDE